VEFYLFLLAERSITYFQTEVISVGGIRNAVSGRAQVCDVKSTHLTGAFAFMLSGVKSSSNRIR